MRETKDLSDLPRVLQPFKWQSCDLNPGLADMEVCFSKQQLLPPSQMGRMRSLVRPGVGAVGHSD